MKSLRNGTGGGEGPFRVFGGTPAPAGTAQSFWPEEKEAAPTKAADSKPFFFAELQLTPAAQAPEHAGAPQTAPKTRRAAPEPLTRLEQAQRQADEILRQARDTAEVLAQQAQQEGREAGHAAGYREGTIAAQKEQDAILAARVEEALEQVQDAVARLEAQRDTLVQQHLEEMRDLCVTIAEKVIQQELAAGGEAIEKMIVAATDRSKKQEWVKVHLSGYDAARLVRGDEAILKALEHISTNVKVVAMDSAQRGDIIIEFPDQIIDAGVTTQLDSIKEILQAGDDG